MVINASAAVTLLEQRPEKDSGSEQDLNPQPLRCQCSALPTGLLSISDVRGQVLFFGLLQGPLGLVRG